MTNSDEVPSNFKPLPMSIRLTAEAIGTALLLATVVGSGIMGTRLSDDTGIALLANSIATGAMLYVLITMFGPSSGAHFNPAVTLALWLRGEMSITTAFAYIGVQILAAIAGVWVAHAMFDMPLWQLSDTVRTGAGQWLAEAVATFGLVSTILFVRQHQPQAVAGAVALYITAGYWFTASTSFANPAVTLARTLTDSFAGIAPPDMPGFIAAQLVGAALAVLAARLMGIKR